MTTSTRRRALLLAVATLLTLASAVQGSSGSTEVAEAVGAEREVSAQGRPNIVMIMVDDMRNDDLKYMPWTRRLIGNQGVRFTNSFSPYPLCCPARASVLTGKYTHNHRVYHVYRPWAFTAFRDGNTIATALKGSGYATVYLGKYLNGYGYMPEPGHTSGNSLNYKPAGWTMWRGSIDAGLPASNPKQGGTYLYFDTTISNNGSGFQNFKGRYQSNVYGELSEDIIKYRAASQAPFFFYASYTAPHNGGPVEPDDPEYVKDRNGNKHYIGTPARPSGVKGRFNDRIKAAPGASWRDRDFSDKPRYLRGLPRLSKAELKAIRNLTRQRAESLSVVDMQVKRTIDALRSTGELDDTLVIFTSDNGYFLGEQHMRDGKKWPHEPSLRVPLLMRGPGIPAGEKRQDPFTSVDFAPTLADLAGVSMSRKVDGVSMLGVARHGDKGWSRAILTETGKEFGRVRKTDLAGGSLQKGEERDIRYLIGIRTKRYLYVNIATGERELYDLAKDPRQYKNVARDRAYADAVDLLRRELHRMRACTGNACSEPMAPALTTGP